MIKRLLIPLLFIYSSLFALPQLKMLQPDEAFKASAKLEGEVIQTKIKLGEKIYVYDNKLKYKIIKPKTKDITKLLKLPKPVEFHGFQVHRKDILVDIPLSLINEKNFILQLEFQGCSERGICYQPMKKTFEFKIDKKTDTTKADKQNTQSQENKIANTLQSGSITKILITFFGFGLLLSLTPCIFPMIPILSSIIVSQSDSKMSAKKGLFLSLIYVLSMSIAYTIAGVFAGLFGANIQTALQNPFVIISFSLIFVALAFSMFGYYEIQLPKSLQNRINKRSEDAKGNGIMGVAIMGFLSALIVGPCVAPPLAGALIYIGQSGDALLGGLALFVMSIGMGFPLLIIGMGAGKFMPKPGGWMMRVSQVFGVVMLGVAIWMISRIIPENITMYLWSILLIGSSIYMGVFEPSQKELRSEFKLIKVLAVIFLLYGASLFIGALTQANNPLNPFEKFITKKESTSSVKNENDFIKVTTLKELNEKINSSKKPVMIDFTAKWCISCTELEHNTFSDENVKKLLKDFTLLQVDVTNNSDEDKNLLKKYNLFGPPGIIFYDKNHQELKNLRVIGYKPPKEFIEKLKIVKGKN